MSRDAQGRRSQHDINARLKEEIGEWRTERSKLWQRLETSERLAKIEVLREVLAEYIKGLENASGFSTPPTLSQVTTIKLQELEQA